MWMLSLKQYIWKLWLFPSSKYFIFNFDGVKAVYWDTKFHGGNASETLEVVKV